MNNGFAVCLGLFTVSCLITSSGAFAADAPISVLVSLEKPSISLGEPVVMEYCIINEAQEQVKAEMGKDLLEWRNISVYGPSGQPLERRYVYNLPKQGGISAGPYRRIQPGEKCRGFVVVSQDYILPSPGEYRITVKARVPTKVGDSDEEQVVSAEQVLLLEVTKADPERLNAVIGELTTIIRTKGDGSRKPAAIESLFAMPQQQAISTWRELALDPSLGLGAQYIQHMLFRFATPDTADILASMGSSSALNSVSAGHAVTTLMNVYWAGDASLKKYVEGLFKNHGWDTSHLGHPVLAMD